MSRLFNDASSQYLKYAGKVVSAVPFSYGAWANSDSPSADQSLLSLADLNKNTNLFYMRLHGSDDLIPDSVAAVLNDGTWAGAGSTTGYSTNTWHHVLGVYASSTSQSVYLDGGSKGTDSVENSPDFSLIDTTAIGGLIRLSPTNFMSGKIAEAAVWNVALTDAEAVTLARGFSPLFVRPQNLVAYWPLIRSDNDIVGGYDMTPYNSPSWGDHPPIIMPAPPFISIPSAAAGTTYLAGKQSLALSQKAPTILFGASYQVAKQALALNQKSPTILFGATHEAGKQALALNQKSPVVLFGATHAAAKQSLALSQKAPTVLFDTTHIAGSQSLILSQKAPTILFGATHEAGKQSLSLQQFSPSITTIAGALFAANKQSLALQQFAPTVFSDLTVSPALQSLVLQQHAAAVISGVVYQANKQSLALQQHAATILFDATFLSNMQSLALGQHAPFVDTTGSTLITPATQRLALQQFTATISGADVSITITPAKQGLALQQFSPAKVGNFLDYQVTAAQSLALSQKAPLFVGGSLETFYLGIKNP